MNTLAQVFADTNVSVRTVLDADGEVWFGCTDVAKAVGYENAYAAVQSLMPDRKDLGEIEPYQSIGRVDFSAIFGAQWRQAKVINLEMLNDFLMDSGKPAAKAFRKWVTGTVLPSIQKTGSYSVHPQPQAEQQFVMPTEEQIALMLLNNIREKNLLAERLGLKDWYTQFQIKQYNWWFTPHVHKTLNAISESMGLQVRSVIPMGSATLRNPINMYHVSVYAEYARRAGWSLKIPEEAVKWNTNQAQLQQLAMSDTSLVAS